MSIRRAVACSYRGSVSTTNICGTDHDFDRPSGTGSLCIATQALRASGVWTFSCASSKRSTGEQKTAQGFSPGNDTHKEIAMKGRPNGISYNVYIYCYMQWLSLYKRSAGAPA